MGIALATLAVIHLSGIGHSNYFSFTVGGVQIASGPWLLGLGDQAWLSFIANLALTAAAFATLTGCIALGEEYGWRGVLQPAMIREFGYGRGIALLGFVWGIWHFPIILSGYNYPESPILGAFVFMPLLLIAASFVMAWLTIRNGSFWPAVLMHGAINSVYDGIVTRVSIDDVSFLVMPLLEIGLFMAVALVLTLAATDIIKLRNTGEQAHPSNSH